MYSDTVNRTKQNSVILRLLNAVTVKQIIVELIQ
jgi:hypothetical protein